MYTTDQYLIVCMADKDTLRQFREGHAGTLLKRLGEDCQIVYARIEIQVTNYLSNKVPRGVLVADDGKLHIHEDAMNAVRRYTEQGLSSATDRSTLGFAPRTVVVPMLPGDLQRDTTVSIWKKFWGKDWSHRTFAGLSSFFLSTYQRNDANIAASHIARILSMVPASYKVKGAYLSGVEASERLYIPNEKSQHRWEDDSEGFAQVGVRHASRLQPEIMLHTPAASAKIGVGTVGFVGSEDLEDVATQSIVLAMFKSET